MKTNSKKKKPQKFAYKQTNKQTKDAIELNEPLHVYGNSISTEKVFKYLGNKPQSVKGKLDFIPLIRKGLRRRSLDNLLEATGITLPEIAAILHTSERTLRRYSSEKKLNPEQSERVIELARLYSRGEEVFGSLDLFKEWIEGNVLALGNKRPKEFLDTSVGIDLLMEELGRIEHGVFA